MKRIFVVLIAVALLSFGAASWAAADDVAVIVHKSNPVDGLTMGQLRKIVLGQQTKWPNEQKIAVLMTTPGQPERDTTLRIVCGMSETSFSASFHARRIQRRSRRSPWTEMVAARGCGAAHGGRVRRAAAAVGRRRRQRRRIHQGLPTGRFSQGRHNRREQPGTTCLQAEIEIATPQSPRCGRVPAPRRSPSRQLSPCAACLSGLENPTTDRQSAPGRLGCVPDGCAVLNTS